MTACLESSARNVGPFRSRQRLVLIPATVLALCLSASAGHAQINPFRGYNGPHLAKADIDQAVQAAGKLLNDDQAKVGASEAWTGPTSGNSGTLTVRSASERGGRSCRVLHADIHYKTGRPRSWTLNVCRTASGAWKIS